MSQSHKVIGSSKSGRTCTHNGNLFTGSRQFLFYQFRVNIVFFAELVHGVGQITMNFSLRNSFVQLFPTATHLTVEVTNTSDCSRDRIIAQSQFKRFIQTIFLNQVDISRNIHVQRTAIFAQRHIQRFASTRMASFFPDMFLVFMTEISQGSKNGIWCSLPQSANSRVFYCSTQ